MAKVVKVDLNSDEKLRLLLIDDHPLFCDAMAMTVEQIFDQPIVRTSSTLNDAVKQAELFNPSLIVLDLNLPDVEGLEGLIRLRSLLPKALIVVVSSISDNTITTGVLAAGARGFVPKDYPRDKLISAFQVIADGGIFTPEDFVQPADDVASDEKNLIIRRLESLTPQQARILELICQGKLNKQIAFDLSIAEATVKAHLTAILRKLGAQNRTQAALLANKVSFRTLSEAE